MNQFVKVNFGPEVKFDPGCLKAVYGAVKNALGREIDDSEFPRLNQEIGNVFRAAVGRATLEQRVPKESSLCLAVSIGSVLGCEGVRCKIEISRNKNANRRRAAIDWRYRPFELSIEPIETRRPRTIYDLYDGNDKVCLSHREVDEFFEALHEISNKIELRGLPLSGYVTECLCKSYEDGLQGGVGDDRGIFLDTGLLYRIGSIEEEGRVLNGEIPIWMLLERRTNKESNTDTSHSVRIVLDPCGESEYICSPRECVCELFQKLHKNVLANSLDDLVELVEDEWGDCSGERVADLVYYLKSIYKRLLDDSLVEESATKWPPFINTESGGLLFCTGLFTSEGGHYVYAYLSDEDADGRFQRIQWLAHGVDECGNRIVNEELMALVDPESPNHGLPFPPNWTREPGRLVFDYHYGSRDSGHIEFNAPHIHANLKARVTKAADFISRYPSCDEDFKMALDERFGWTRKLLQGNFKIAIPTFYRGEIQLLVPLYLGDDKNEVSAALVVALNKDENKDCHYYCPTCLSLEMARRDSRVITRIQNTWLVEGKGFQCGQS